jgi:Cu/Ag efflux pump CusA
MAFAIIGGLAVATVLTLILLPALMSPPPKLSWVTAEEILRIIA